MSASPRKGEDPYFGKMMKNSNLPKSGLILNRYQHHYKNTNMDMPLTTFYCDVCGQSIESVDLGYVIWKTDSSYKSHNFKIIHQQKCDQKDYPSSAALSDFLGEQGLTRLTAMLSLGPIKQHIGQRSRCDVTDMDEFVDFMRRVQTPYYEEARRLFPKRNLLEWFSDANEVLPYLPETLKRIISEYNGK